MSVNNGIRMQGHDKQEQGRYLGEVMEVSVGELRISEDKSQD